MCVRVLSTPQLVGPVSPDRGETLLIFYSKRKLVFGASTCCDSDGMFNKITRRPVGLFFGWAFAVFFLFLGGS